MRTFDYSSVVAGGMNWATNTPGDMMQYVNRPEGKKESLVLRCCGCLSGKYRSGRQYRDRCGTSMNATWSLRCGLEGYGGVDLRNIGSVDEYPMPEITVDTAADVSVVSRAWIHVPSNLFGVRIPSIPSTLFGVRISSNPFGRTYIGSVPKEFFVLSAIKLLLLLFCLFAFCATSFSFCCLSWGTFFVFLGWCSILSSLDCGFVTF